MPIFQSVEVSGGAGPSAGINVNAGSTIVVVVTGGSGAGYTPTDNGGNTWPGSPTINFDAAGARLAIWVLENCAAKTGYQVTVTSAGGDSAFSVHEVRGVLAASLDTGATNSGSGAEPFTLNAAAALAQANNTIISGMLPYMSGDPVTYAANTGYTIASEENNNNSFYGQGVASKSVTSTTAPSVQWDTTGATGDVFVGIIALKESGGGDVTVSPTGIASAEAFGAPALSADVAPSGIATAEAFGAPSIEPAITATGIASAEAFGVPSVSADIAPAGIASGEAFGVPIISTDAIVAPVGIASEEAFGVPTLSVVLQMAGIPSAEAFGVPTIGEEPAPPAPAPGGSEFGPGGRRTRNFKPLLERMLETRYPRVKPRAERAQKRAKAIEIRGAELVLEESPTLAEFEALAALWMAQQPVMPEVGLDPLAVYLAQVAFRLRQQQALQEALARRRRQDEDAILVLLLA